MKNNTNANNPRGQRRPRDGHGKGTIQGGRRLGKNTSGCKIKGPGYGNGKGQGKGQHRDG